MKKYIYTMLCCATMILFAGSAFAETAKAPLKSVNEKGELEEIGVVTFTDTPEGLLMDIDVIEFPVGTHTLHVKKGDCNPENFKKTRDAKDAATSKVTVGTNGKGKASHTTKDMKVSDVRDHAVILHSKNKKDAAPGAKAPLACGVVK